VSDFYICFYQSSGGDGHAAPSLDDDAHEVLDDSEALDDVSEAEEILPLEVYTIDDLLAESKKLDTFRRKIGEKLNAKIDGSSEPPPRRQRQCGPRRYISRNREAGHDELVANYFSANPIYADKMFRRRFRMNKSLFL